MNNQRIWGIALGFSLAVNVFCVSALLTGWLTPPSPGHEAARAHLPPRARALFEELAPHRQPGFRAARRDIHQRREAVRDALVAEPFDADALSLALSQLRQAEGAAASLAHQRIIEVAGSLPVEERQWLQRFVGRRPGRGPRPMQPADPKALRPAPGP